MLQGSTVTIENGTLTSKTAKLLIQNYCDLTIRNATLSGQDNLTEIIVSNNNGSTVITGNSAVQAAAGGIAFESDEESSSEKTEQTAGSEQAASSQHSAASSKTIDKPQAESSPQKTQSAASASASASASSKPAPAGYEEELKALIRQVYAVKARAEKTGSGIGLHIANDYRKTA